MEVDLSIAAKRLRYEAELLQIQDQTLKHTAYINDTVPRYAALIWQIKLFWNDYIMGSPKQRAFYRGKLTNLWVYLLRCGGNQWFKCYYIKYYFINVAKFHWLVVTHPLSNHLFLRNWSTLKGQQNLRIMVVGVGGVGDVLLVTPIVQALKKLVPSAEICLLFANAGVAGILYGNKDIASVAPITWRDVEPITKAALASNSVDVVVRSFYAIEYLLSSEFKKSAAKQALFPPNFFDKAAIAFSSWRPYTKRHLLFANLMARHAEEQGYHLLDVAGITGGLEINRHSTLFFLVTPKDDAQIAQLVPSQQIITVHHGADNNATSRVADGQVTKMLPYASWVEITEQLIQKGFIVVQLGTTNEKLIAGVSIDLRGKTSLRQTAALIKRGLCHIDTEGGLAHLARAVEKPSVILFGPTSKSFFGYPDNRNLVAGACQNCWCVTLDWTIECPRQLQQPECMSSHQPEVVVQEVLALIKKS